MNDNRMLDLETLGTGNNAVIISIGAVLFDKDGVSNETFYKRIDPQSCVDVGMEMSTSTVMWWMKQSDAARVEFNKPTVSIQQALLSFTTWLIQHAGDFEDRKVWGNGATFDNVILDNAYKKCKLEKLWPYWGDACYRTLKNLFPEVKMERTGTFHNALDDARSQAFHCIRLLKAAGVWK
jgi:exodeoxyribonuclease VIII